MLLGIFEDSEVTHVLDSIDPVRDLEIIQEELLLKDLATCSQEVVALEKVVHREKHRKPELVLSLTPLSINVLTLCLGSVQEVRRAPQSKQTHQIWRLEAWRCMKIEWGM